MELRKPDFSLKSKIYVILFKHLQKGVMKYSLSLLLKVSSSHLISESRAFGSQLSHNKARITSLIGVIFQN